MSKPREEVIRRLAHEAIKAMDGNGIEDLTPSEVISAGFTVVKTMVVMCTSTDGEMSGVVSRESLLQAIAELYALVAPEKVN